MPEKIKQRLEFIGGNSYKFWEIETFGNYYIVTFGRIGTNGQQRKKQFPTKIQCYRAAEDIIRKKYNKGYHDENVTSDASQFMTFVGDDASRMTYAPYVEYGQKPRRKATLKSRARPKPKTRRKQKPKCFGKTEWYPKCDDCEWFEKCDKSAPRERGAYLEFD